MKRNLWLLNLLLLAGIVALGLHIRQTFRDARLREEALIQKRLPVYPAAVFQAPGAVTRVTAGTYADVALRMLFAKDRNPNVIIDPPAPVKEVPMPPLPRSHGFMNWGTPVIILSEKPGAPQKRYQAGEQVGPFKLVAVNEREATFEWEGKRVTESLEKLVDRTAAPAEQVAAGAAAPLAAVPPAPVVKRSAEELAKPGQDVGFKAQKACQAGDNSPSGTVQDGYRKMVTPTPFGPRCVWEPVN